MLKQNLKIIILVLLLVLFFLPKISQAALLPTPTGSCPHGYECGSVEGGMCGSSNLECNYTLDDILRGFVEFSEWVLSILGTIALLMFIVGGVIYLTSGGNEEKVKQGTAILKGTVVGMVIALLAWSIVHFVLDILNVDQQYQTALRGGTTIEDTCGNADATRGYNCMDITACGLPNNLDHCIAMNQCYRGKCLSNSNPSVVCCDAMPRCGTGSQYCYWRAECLSGETLLDAMGPPPSPDTTNCCCLD